MAPTLTRSRVTKTQPSIRTKPSAPPTSVKAPNTETSLFSDSSLPSNKRDKRQIKHSLLLSRLKSSKSSTSKIQKKRIKARESKSRKEKLSVKLQDLGDALPDATSNIAMSVSSQAGGIAAGSTVVGQSLRQRPGHAKRIRKLGDMERKRFASNLSIMSGGKASAGSAKPSTSVASGDDSSSKDAHAARWAALRQHIQAQQQ